MPCSHDELWTTAFYLAFDPQVRVVGFQQSPPDFHAVPAKPLIEDFDLWFITGGRGGVRIDGEWIEFAANDLLIIRPGERYEEEWTDPTDPHVQYFLHMLPFGEDHHGYGPALAEQWPRKMSMAHQPRLGPLFADLFDTFVAKVDGYPLRMKALALSILERILPSLQHRGDDEDLPPAYPCLMAARDFIVRHHCSDMTLDDIAEHADLSASYLSALFRRYLGCSPIEYRIRLQLRTARRRLAAGRSVSEAAREAGFHSLHYFSRMFRKHHDQPPTDFAASCRGK